MGNFFVNVIANVAKLNVLVCQVYEMYLFLIYYL